MLPSDIKWYVVRTAPREEEAAARNLRREGYRALYLHTSEWTAGSARRKSRLTRSPIFPGYVLVGLGPDKFVGGVPVMYGVTNAVGVTDVLGPVSSSEVRRLTSDADETGMVDKRSAGAEAAWRRWLHNSAPKWMVDRLLKSG